METIQAAVARKVAPKDGKPIVTVPILEGRDCVPEFSSKLFVNAHFYADDFIRDARCDPSCRPAVYIMRDRQQLITHISFEYYEFYEIYSMNVT